MGCHPCHPTPCHPSIQWAAGLSCHPCHPSIQHRQTFRRALYRTQLDGIAGHVGCGSGRNKTASCAPATVSARIIEAPLCTCLATSTSLEVAGMVAFARLQCSSSEIRACMHFTPKFTDDDHAQMMKP